MNIEKKVVQRDCTYKDTILLKGDIVYISDYCNFGLQKVYNQDRKLLFFAELEWYDFNEDVRKNDPAFINNSLFRKREQNKSEWRN